MSWTTAHFQETLEMDMEALTRAEVNACREQITDPHALARFDALWDSYFKMLGEMRSEKR